MKRKSIQKYFYLLAIFFATNICFSQINCFSGENVRFEIKDWFVSANSISQISFLVKSTNPAVFFINNQKKREQMLPFYEKK